MKDALLIEFLLLLLILRSSNKNSIFKSDWLLKLYLKEKNNNNNFRIDFSYKFRIVN